MSLINVEVELVPSCEYSITVFTLILVSPREVNGLRKGLI